MNACFAVSLRWLLFAWKMSFFALAACCSPPPLRPTANLHTLHTNQSRIAMVAGGKNKIVYLNYVRRVVSGDEVMRCATEIDFRLRARDDLFRFSSSHSWNFHFTQWNRTRIEVFLDVWSDQIGYSINCIRPEIDRSCVCDSTCVTIESPEWSWPIRNLMTTRDRPFHSIQFHSLAKNNCIRQFTCVCFFFLQKVEFRWPPVFVLIR